MNKEVIPAGSVVKKLQNIPVKWNFEDVRFKCRFETLQEALAAINKELSTIGAVGVYTFFDNLEANGVKLEGYDAYKRGTEPGWCMTCVSGWTDLWIEFQYYVDTEKVDEIILRATHAPCDAWQTCE